MEVFSLLIEVFCPACHNMVILVFDMECNEIRHEDLISLIFAIKYINKIDIFPADDPKRLTFGYIDAITDAYHIMSWTKIRTPGSLCEKYSISEKEDSDLKNLFANRMSFLKWIRNEEENLECDFIMGKLLKYRAFL